MLFLMAVGLFIRALCIRARHFRYRDRSDRHLLAQLYLRHIRLPLAREQT